MLCPARIASASAWSSGLSTSTPASGLPELHCLELSPSLSPSRSSTWSRLNRRAAMTSIITGPSRDIIRHAFLRSCSTALHCSIAGRTSGEPSANRLAPVKAPPRNLSQVRSRVGKPAKQQPALDDADRDVGAFSSAAEFVDRLGIEQGMVGGGHQQRPADRESSSSRAGSRRSCRPRRGTRAARHRARRPRAAPAPGRARSLADLRAGQQSAHRADDHRLAADRDQRLEVGPESSAKASPPGREPASTSAVKVTPRARRRCARRAPLARSPGRSARHGRSG